MKKLLTVAMLAASLALSACAGTLGGVVSPAPLEQTTVDEKALIAAYDAFDVALTAIDGLRVAGVIKDGSPTALKVRGYILAAQTGLNAARDAQAGLSTANPVEALTRAGSALRDLSLLLRNLS